MSGGQEVITVTLRSQTDALSDERVRATVESAARALAERQGVKLVELMVDERELIATLVGSEVVGVGFVSELRRTTETWYTKRTGEPTLWGLPNL